MKIFKHRNLMGCIYALLMAVPLFSILGRTCYTIFNKNAYQSYSGTNQNTESIENVSTINDFDYSKTYYLGNSVLDIAPSSPSSSAFMYFDSVEVINNNTNTTNEIISQFDRMYIYVSTTTMFYNFYVGTTNYTLNSGQDFLLKVKIRSFNGADNAFDALNYDLTHSNLLYYIEYFYEQQLDNAFDYSLSKFVNDNDFGRLNFFQWFWDIFLTNNQQNNLYIHFVNWYMNFALCVSSAYILFLVLMWFINYSRRILERGMNYDW